MAGRVVKCIRHYIQSEYIDPLRSEKTEYRPLNMSLNQGGYLVFIEVAGICNPFYLYPRTLWSEVRVVPRTSDVVQSFPACVEGGKIT